jgi:PPOX class probable F420-dependent enzyme
MEEAIMLFDPSNPVHAAALGRLESESGIWLTTVSPAGQPQSSLVWFLWDGTEVLIYGSKNGPKLPNIKANPRVGLNLDSDGSGGGVVVLEGTARIDEVAPPSSQVPEYVAKYAAGVQGLGWTFGKFDVDYPHAIRVTPTRARIW